jgi:hypothetical protein
LFNQAWTNKKAPQNSQSVDEIPRKKKEKRGEDGNSEKKKKKQMTKGQLSLLKIVK